MPMPSDSSTCAGNSNDRGPISAGYCGTTHWLIKQRVFQFDIKSYVNIALLVSMNARFSPWTIANMSRSDEPKTYPDRKYTISFGRVGDGLQGGRKAKWQLVGREGQRAFLIDRLIHMGRSGAFLITGRRGVGKTSFVQYCLSMYEEDILSRFRRSNLARSFFGFIYLIFFLVLIMTTTFAAHAVSEQLWSTIRTIGEGQELIPIRYGLQLVVLTLIMAVFLLPVVVGKSQIEMLFGPNRERIRANLSILISALMIALIFFLVDAGRPEVFTFRCIFILSAISMWISGCSFGKAYDEKENTVQGFPREYLVTIAFIFLLHAAEKISYAFALKDGADDGFWILLISHPNEYDSSDIKSIINIYIISSLACLIAGKIFRLLNQRWLSELIEFSSRIKDEYRNQNTADNNEEEKTLYILDSGVLFAYVFAFFYLYCVSLQFWFRVRLFWKLWSSLCNCSYFSSNTDKGDRQHK